MRDLAIRAPLAMVHHVAQPRSRCTTSPRLMQLNDSPGTARVPHMAQSNASMPVCLFATIHLPCASGQAKGRVVLGDAESFVSVDSIATIARGAYQGKSEMEIRGLAMSCKAWRLLCGPSPVLTALRTRFSCRPISATTPTLRLLCVAKSLELITASRVFHCVGWIAWRFVRRSPSWQINFAGKPAASARNSGGSAQIISPFF